MRDGVEALEQLRKEMADCTHESRAVRERSADLRWKPGAIRGLNTRDSRVLSGASGTDGFVAAVDGDASAFPRRLNEFSWGAWRCFLRRLREKAMQHAVGQPVMSQRSKSWDDS